MKILYLGPEKTDDYTFVVNLRRNRAVTFTDKPIRETDVQDYDLVVSYRYRHIIPARVIEAAPCPMVNLYISCLPYNRGSHPNVWAWHDGTPHGVTIHEISRRVDRGGIYLQRKIEMNPAEETLRTSWARLCREVERLFSNEFLPNHDALIPYAQPAWGTEHRKADLELVRYAMRRGWDTPVNEFLGVIAETGMAATAEDRVRGRK